MTEATHSNIRELSLEAVMGERFDVIPNILFVNAPCLDIRDGLKPVQRRILFAMNEDGNTFDKPFRKSAKSVGNVMGNYHPHGDSSIYEAMVRLSQYWKLREPLIEMHGNNGSMDGDPPAAMRYTEARLSEIAAEMLKDIDKKTVEMVPNFDDTEFEPTVLPARFPNLLVNGATGISGICDGDSDAQPFRNNSCNDLSDGSSESRVGRSHEIHQGTRLPDGRNHAWFGRHQESL